MVEKCCFFKSSCCRKIKSHNLPVIIYGAANGAYAVSNILNSYGVEIFGYAVDEKYYKPNQTYLGRKLYNFAELRKTPEKYVFVLGLAVKKTFLDFLNANDIISYNLGLEDSPQPIPYEYMVDNKKMFVETYNLLADDFSRKTMAAYLKAHITSNYRYTLDVITSTEYFNELDKVVLFKV